MSNYLISGYYGFSNAGDEAILQAIINSLRSQDRQATITVLSSNPSVTETEHEVQAIHRTNLPQIIRALRRADLFISGGGGLLQDATSNRSLLYYLGLLSLARYLGCKTMVYANSIGPISRPGNKKLTRYVLDRTDRITVRDKLSKQLLAELGVTGPKIDLTADPVLLLETPAVQPQERLIAIAVREWPSQHDYLAAVLACGRRLVQDGFSLLFIPFHYGRDLAIAENLAAAIGTGASCLSQPHNFIELLDDLAAAELVVGMRLHALIMGAVCNRPLVGISYDPKIEGFLQSIDQPLAGTTDDLDAARLYDLVTTAYQRRQETRLQLDTRLSTLRELAVLNAKFASELARGEQA